MSASTQKIAKLQCTSIMRRNTWSGETMCAVACDGTLKRLHISKSCHFPSLQEQDFVTAAKLGDCFNC